MNERAFCPSCGTRVHRDYRFCRSCGFSLVDNEDEESILARDIAALALDSMVAYMARASWTLEARRGNAATFISSQSGRQISLHAASDGSIVQDGGPPLDLDRFRSEFRAVNAPDDMTTTIGEPEADPEAEIQQEAGTPSDDRDRPESRLVTATPTVYLPPYRRVRRFALEDDYTPARRPSRRHESPIGARIAAAILVAAPAAVLLGIILGLIVGGGSSGGLLTDWTILVSLVVFSTLFASRAMRLRDCFRRGFLTIALEAFTFPVVVLIFTAVVGSSSISQGQSDAAVAGAAIATGLVGLALVVVGIATAIAVGVPCLVLYFVLREPAESISSEADLFAPGFLGAVILLGVIAALVGVGRHLGTRETSGTSRSPSPTVVARAAPAANVPPTAPPDKPFAPSTNVQSSTYVQPSIPISATLAVQSFTCTWDTFGDSGGFAYVQGNVTNISSQPVRDAEAIGSWYTSGGQFIRSDDALIEFNPILPGQTSPFKTISTYNPAMSRCQLQFKSLLGAPISATFPGAG